MEKKNANLIVELLLGILTAAITTTVLIAAATDSYPVSVEKIKPDKNPWIGTKIVLRKNLA